MREQPISFEVAKLAKEKGFNIRSEPYRYNSNGELTLLEGINAPTQSLLQKWLREEHKLYVEIFTANYAWNDKVKFYYHVREIHSKHDDKYHNYRTEIVGTYEEALEVGLFEGLKLIKNEEN